MYLTVLLSIHELFVKCRHNYIHNNRLPTYEKLDVLNNRPITPQWLQTYWQIVGKEFICAVQSTTKSSPQLFISFFKFHMRPSILSPPVHNWFYFVTKLETSIQANKICKLYIYIYIKLHGVFVELTQKQVETCYTYKKN
jgi:hypothetical protein